MASSQISETSYPVRSISLPSTPHPIAQLFDEQLCRLRSSQTASTSSPPSERLAALNDLYLSFYDVLQLPSNHQAISHNYKFLDGSLRVLDICGVSRDVLEQSKEGLQDIQSVISRRPSGDLYIVKEILEYLNIRKNTKKAVKKCLKNIREGDNSETVSVIDSLLKDLEKITTDILKSVLAYISGSKSSSQNNFSSLVTKIFHQTTGKDAAAEPTGEFDALDVALVSLMSQRKTVNIIQIDSMRNQMVTLESEIQALEEELECLFRHLVKTRASLLNILSK